jgi:hypothetical protein
MSRTVAVLVVLCGLLLAGVLLTRGEPEHMARVDSTSPTPSPSATATVVPGASGPTAAPVSSTHLDGDPYADLAAQLHARGVQVWFEIDLVARWLAGPASFQEGLDRMHTLAGVPGVQGFKVADELGYDDGIDSPEQAAAFLRAVRAGMAATVGRRVQVLVDVVVPDLGCLGWQDGGSPNPEAATCARAARVKHPAAVESAVTSYLRQGLVDRLDLSTSLLDEWTYQSWGLSQAEAQARAWQHVKRLGWDRMTVLQSRKALADAGGYQGSPMQALHDVHTFVDIPVRSGAKAVDVWTWRQAYDGRTVSLLDDGLDPNPLWRQLEARHRDGVRLVTHITPSMLLPSAEQRSREYNLYASVFDAAFVAAGSG